MSWLIASPDVSERLSAVDVAVDRDAGLDPERYPHEGVRVSPWIPLTVAVVLVPFALASGVFNGVSLVAVLLAGTAIHGFINTAVRKAES